MSEVIHTQLKVSLLDKVTGPMKKVLASNKKLDQQIKKTSQLLEKARGPVKLIKDFKKQNEALKKVTDAYWETRRAVAKLAGEMKSVSQPTAKMTREMERLREKLSSAGRKMREQQDKLRPLISSLREAGVNVARLGSEEQRLQNHLARTNRLMKKQLELASQFSEARAKMTAGVRGGLGRMAVGGGMIAGGVAGLRKLWSPVQKAVDFEAEFANVVKKANFKSEKEKKAYRQWILTMSTKTPMSAAGIAAISAAAYEGGISDQEDNKRFTEMVIKASIAWDVSPEEAGRRLARVYKAFGRDLDKLSLHMDRINHLSNTWALSAAELLEYYSRVQAELSAKGFTSAQISALGAFSIAGDYNPDVVATSIRRITDSLTAGRSATKAQKKVLRRLGINPITLAKKASKDAWGAFLLVMRRLQKVKDWERPAMIKRLFGAEAKTASLFFQMMKDKKTGKMMTGLDYLLQAYASVASPEKYRGSAEQEYDTRVEAPDMKFRMLMNQFTELGIKIGTAVLPALIKLTETISPLIESVSKWIEKNTELVKNAMLLAGGFLAAKIAVGAFTAALGIAKAGKAVAGYGLELISLRRKQRLYGRISERLAGGAARKFALRNLVTPITWTAGLIPPIPWRRLAGPLRWEKLISPLKWGGSLISKIPWVATAGKLSWRMLITPLKWGGRFIARLWWPAFVADLAWNAFIKPLGWDKYIKAGLKSAWSWVEEQSKAGWEKVRNMEPLDWAKLALTGLPNIINRIVEKFTGINLFDAGAKALSSLWEGMKSIWKGFRKWIDEITASISAAFSGIEPKINAEKRAASRHGPRSGGTMQGIGTIPQRPARKRAVGGLILPGLPTLVGERGPELIYPTRAGWVAHNENVRRLAKMAAAASVATPLFVSPPVPAVAASAAAPSATQVPAAPVSRTVQITVAPGAVQIHAAGMGPEAIAEELGRRLGDALRATMADVEDV